MTIARDDWPRLLDLVEQAMDVPAAEHEAWLGELGLLPALEAVLRSLLEDRRAIETGDFLAALPQLPPLSARASAEGGPVPGRSAASTLIGPWRLLRELGQGGMSSVWLAERADAQVTRQVALKLPHAGPGQDLLAQRLLRERNILAGLEHPNIARLYDVGLTEAGTPYLVMEYVDGDSLLAHAAAQQLTLAQRLALFQQVLRAVQYAHSKLVLHRDLKPGNILVNRAGEVKLLDFGIAKALDPDGTAQGGPSAADSALTRHGGGVLTPEYAAPEQIAGLPLGTGCDVYALGVVLFELLTGERPYRLPREGRARRSALEQAILNTEPTRPGTIDRALRGDLDVILLTALHKAPAQRYATADAFAQDIARHLAREPIQARPGSAGYRLRKFVSRNALAVGAGTAVFAALAIGLGAALWQGQQARLEAAKATAIKDFLVGLLHTNDIDLDDALHKRQQTVQQLLARSASDLKSGLGGQPEVRSELQGVVGGLLDNLEMFDAAIPLRRQRAEDLAARQAPVAEQAQALRDLAESQRVDPATSLVTLRRGMALCVQRHASQSMACQGIQLDLGRNLLAAGRLDEAAQEIEPVAWKLSTQDPHGIDGAMALSNLGELRNAQGRPDEAHDLMQQALRRFEALWGPRSARLAREQRLFAVGAGQQRHLAEAVAGLDAAWQTMSAAAGTQSVMAAEIELDLGQLQARVGGAARGAPHIRHASEVLLASSGPDRLRQVFQARLISAELLLYDGRLAEAGEALRLLDAAASQATLMSIDGRDVDLLNARYLQQCGHFDAALARLRERRGLMVAAYGASSAQVADIDTRIVANRLLAGDIPAAEALLPAHPPGQPPVALLLAQGDYAAAWPAVQARHAEVQRRARDDQYLGVVLESSEQMARTLAGLGRLAEAKPHFEAALALLEPGYPNNPALAALRARYAICLWALGDDLAARAQLARAEQALRAEPLAGPQFVQPVRDALKKMAKKNL